ncbi:MAG: hypothetical protein AB7O52_08540 [Planctomycetota bacterium]
MLNLELGARWARRAMELTLVGVLGLAVGCNGGGGGGGGAAPGAGPVASTAEFEQNDTAATATELPVEVAGTGDLVVGTDVDFWRFSAVAGEFVTVELRAASLDQEAWNGACSGPLLEILDPNGASIFRHHSASWSWGPIDLDMPMIPIETSGEHLVRLENRDSAQPGGHYAVRVSRSAATFQLEQEPVGTPGLNDNVANAEPIVPGRLWGFHVAGEHDYYRFTVTAPSLMRAELTAYRNGINPGQTNYYDPLMHLRNSAGTSLSSNDDRFFYDSELVYLITQPGDYFVDVFQFSGTGEYVLTLELSPTGMPAPFAGNDAIASAAPLALEELVEDEVGQNEADYYRFDGRAGDLLRIQHWSGSLHQGSSVAAQIMVLGPDGMTSVPASNSSQAVRAILTEDGPHYLRITNGNNVNPSVYALRVTVVEESEFEHEPNNQILNAAPLARGGAGSGRIESAADVDLFRFDTQAGELVTFSAYAGPGRSNGFLAYNLHGSVLRASLRVRDAAGGVLAESVVAGAGICVGAERITNGLAALELAFLPATGGTYYLEVGSSDATVGAQATYVVTRR